MSGGILAKAADGCLSSFSSFEQVAVGLGVHPDRPRDDASMMRRSRRYSMDSKGSCGGTGQWLGVSADTKLCCDVFPNHYKNCYREPKRIGPSIIRMARKYLGISGAERGT